MATTQNERILRKYGIVASAEAVARAAADRPRLAELKKCQKSSWYLATEILGYGWSPTHRKGLSERLDKPIMDWYDRHRDDPFIGIWMRRKFGHKTTRVVTWIIQGWLIDPCMTQGYFHAVDELASDVCGEIANHIIRTKKLRALDPVGVDPEGKLYKIFPHTASKRFATSDRIRINSHRYDRTPSLTAKGAGSEVTGCHFSGPVWLDDIIARRTIENSELQKIARWVQNTILPISSMKIRGTGTPWSEQSVHQAWMQDPDWTTLVLPASVKEDDAEILRRLVSDEKKIHFAPDYTFANPTFWPVDHAAKARKQLRLEQKQMKSDFSPQIMCDSEPESERFWSESACEHFCGAEARDGVPGAFEGQGITVVLSDPAPLHAGSYRGIGEKQRMDGTKDWWSVAVVRIRTRVALRERVLLDGIHSMDWREDQGCDAICGLMKKWRTNLFVSEDPDAWHDRMVLASRRNGVALRRADDGGPLKFRIYNKAQRKIQSFTDLSSAARDGLFYIYDKCPKEFLYGDGEHVGFLTQMRKVRQIAYSDKSRTNLRWDDDGDVVARSGDPLFEEMVSLPEASREHEVDWWGDPLYPVEQYHHRSRYCGV